MLVLLPSSRGMYGRAVDLLVGNSEPRQPLFQLSHVSFFQAAIRRPKAKPRRCCGNLREHRALLPKKASDTDKLMEAAGEVRLGNQWKTVEDCPAMLRWELPFKQFIRTSGKSILTLQKVS